MNAERCRRRLAPCALVALAAIATSCGGTGGGLHYEVAACDREDELAALLEPVESRPDDAQFAAVDAVIERIHDDFESAAESPYPAFRSLSAAELDEDALRRLDAMCSVFDAWEPTTRDRSKRFDRWDIEVDANLTTDLAARTGDATTGRFEFWDAEGGGAFQTAGRGVFDTEAGLLAQTSWTAMGGEPSEPSEIDWDGPIMFGAPTETVTTEDALYLRGGWATALVQVIDELPERPTDLDAWLRIDFGRMDLDPRLGPFVPSHDVESFRASLAVLTTTPVDVGRESVRGVPTQRVRIDVTLREAFAAAGRSPTDQVDLDPTLADRLDEPYAQEDLWIGRDGLVRRMTTRTNDERVTSSSFLELFDYGTDVAITVPPEARDITDALLALQADGAEGDGG